MKRNYLFILLITLSFCLSAQEKKVKKGWKFGGALPAVSYDNNLGFQYGALFEFFNYGDGSKYPDFLDHTYTEASHYTKGSGIFRFMYESNHLIKGVHMTSDLSYLPDQANHFYGFNGYESVYNKDWMDDEITGSPYRTSMFYRFKKNQFRFKNDFQGKLSGDYIKWSAGFAFQNFVISSVDIDKLNKGKDVKIPSVADQPGLYERYQVLGIISENEAGGGWVNTIKAGVAYDSRDNRPNPMKGIWTEIGIEAAPSLMGNDNGFSKLYVTHRQYFTLIEKDLSFVYRVGYQTTLSGTVPYYYQSQVITSMLTGATSEGLGGASTLRGVLKNRIVGDGFFYGNIELRWKPLYFTFLKQDCYLGLDGFYDFGMITKKIKLPDNLETTFNEKYPTENYSDFFNPGSEKLHQSAGISIMAAMNQNFVVAIDMGKALNKQDGNIGFAIGLNYLF
ncbi:MAG TPA: BamA/TamA family outer membrane protein [Bacteroidales bacterium]|nr:BamA/TamA family outer membrane protein [Bacteroidales bacterium]HPT21595.1 BamA/TamA family outer membrane protein [Bacteroidales bacterium]